ncbi:MAG: peptidylprolyl isomerase [Planctomycetota bacterium]
MLPLPGHEVDPQLQGLLSARLLAGWLFAGLLCSCQGPAGKRVAQGGNALQDPLPAPPPVVAPLQPPPQVGGLAPAEVLIPPADGEDAEVARVGDLVLRQSHAYQRLLSAHPKLALSAVDLLVFDVLVARHAEQFDIRVDPARVEALSQQEENELRQQLQNELPDLSFADYVWRLFGMRENDWRSTLRLRTAQRLYQGYVLRYLALREERVQVRFLVHKDRTVVQEVADKVRAGADFATLALRLSEDTSRRDGGLLPAFGRGFQHPAAQHAFELQPGQVCEPFEANYGGEPRWFCVYCLSRRPGRDVSFEAVREEIERDLEQQPITPLETTAYTLRWRDAEAGAAGGTAQEPLMQGGGTRESGAPLR